MARQKQVEAALSRCFKGNPPRGKCKASLSEDERLLTFHHYHHLLLVYDMEDRSAIYTWYEKLTDKRILDAAIAALTEGPFGTLR